MVINLDLRSPTSYRHLQPSQETIDKTVTLSFLERELCKTLLLFLLLSLMSDAEAFRNVKANITFIENL